jgi:hypothetical protein
VESHDSELLNLLWSRAKVANSPSDMAASVRHVGASEKSVGAWLRVSRAGGLSFLWLCFFVGAASAQSDSPGSEFFTGFEASDNYASGYVARAMP